MRTMKLLLLTSLFVVPSVAAQGDKNAKDSSFKNVEYLSGVASMSDKQKGTLVVTATEVRLVDKKGKPYFAIPVAEIREIKDTSFAPPESRKKGAQVDGMPKLPGFLKKSRPDGQITISTQKDSTSPKSAIVLQINEKGTLRQVTAALRSPLNRSTAAAAPGAAGGGGAGDSAGQAAGPALRMLVANPFSAAATDSAAAVEVGSMVRTEIKQFVGDKLEIVTREQMNAALDQFGYPRDAILNHDLAIMLAKTLGVPFIMTGNMTKGTDGKYTVVTSLGGVNDTTGKTTTVVQLDGESLTDFGHRIAETLK